MNMIDIHTHLLPGVDDGVQSREEAEEMLAAYHRAGISAVVCTPHLSNPYVRTRIMEIRESYVWFCKTASQYG